MSHERLMQCPNCFATWGIDATEKDCCDCDVQPNIVDADDLLNADFDNDVETDYEPDDNYDIE